jgi:hypothetical protein
MAARISSRSKEGQSLRIFLKGGSGSEQFENINHADALAANAGAAPAFTLFDRDSTKTLQVHGTRSIF